MGNWVCSCLSKDEDESPRDQKLCLPPPAAGPKPEPEAEPTGSEAAGAGQTKVEEDTFRSAPKAHPTSSESTDSGQAKATENAFHLGVSLSGMSKSMIPPKARTPEPVPSNLKPAARDSTPEHVPSSSNPTAKDSMSEHVQSSSQLTAEDSSHAGDVRQIPPAVLSSLDTNFAPKTDEAQPTSKVEKDGEANPIAVVEEKPSMKSVEGKDQEAKPTEAKEDEGKPAEAEERKTILQKAEEVLVKVEEKVEHAKEAIKEAVHHHPAEEWPARQKSSDSVQLTETDLNAPDGSIWVVIGGEDKGGIVTRKGESLNSQILPRLSTGARVKQLELKGERLHYQLIDGTGHGPDFGWVSLRIKGKRLLVLAKEQQ